MSEWKDYYLGDVVDYKKGFAFKSNWYQRQGRYIVRVSDTTLNSINIASCNCISEELASQFEDYSLMKDDVIIATVGSWPNNPSSVVGKVVKVPDEANNALLNQNAVRLRGNEKIDNKFLYYLLKNNSFSKYIVSKAQGSANQASITLKDIFGFSFKAPELEEQSLIANYLYAIDSKIAVNRRICENLEAQAQALFKHWFIDFAPFKNGKFVESELGMIPEGWRVMSIDDIYSIKYGKNLPTSKIKEKGDYPVYGANGIMGYYNTYNYDNYVTLITSRGSGSGDVSRTFQEKAFITNNSFAVNPKDNYFYLGCGYTYYCIKNINFKPFCSGSAQPQLTNTSISAISILLPDKNVVIKYNSLASYIQKEINQAYIESNRLATLRDTLLPKLMSGQIKV